MNLKDADFKEDPAQFVSHIVGWLSIISLVLKARSCSSELASKLKKNICISLHWEATMIVSGENVQTKSELSVLFSHTMCSEARKEDQTSPLSARDVFRQLLFHARVVERRIVTGTIWRWETSHSCLPWHVLICYWKGESSYEYLVRFHWCAGEMTFPKNVTLKLV